MRKDKEQQKKTEGNQLNMFSIPNAPARRSIGRTDMEAGTGVDLFSRLESQRTLTSNLLNKIVDYENLKWFALQGLQSLYLRVNV